MTDRARATLSRDTWIIHAAVVLSYFGKAMTKAVSGFLLGSPPLINDAIHGFIDIGEHGLIAVVGRQARKDAEARFPLGRKPLLDVVGFVIGLSMAGLGLKCLKDGFAAVVHAADLLFGIVEKMPPWVVGLLPELTRYGDPSGIWIVGAIFTGCAVVSLAVYRLEYGLARKHRLKEYQDDAAELRQDAVLELATGLCLLGAWMLVLIARALFRAEWSFDAVNAVTTAAVLLGLCGYLLTHAKHAIVENVHNLLHPGLDEDSLGLLKSHLKRALPFGCDLLAETAADVTAYTSGDALHVAGTIRIPRAQMAACDAILDHAQRVAAAFLDGKAEEVKVRFFPAPEAWKPSDAESEWRRLLGEVWQVQAQGPEWECFRSLKTGDLRTAVRLAGSDAGGFEAGSLLRLWVHAAAVLFLHGGRAPEADAAASRIDRAVAAMSEGDPKALAFHVWRVLRAVVSGLIHDKSSKPSVDASRKLLESAVDDDGQTPGVLGAEAAFVLGMLAERQDDYDLALADRRYRQALSLYLGSGFPLEADRLLNTWGHQKSLLYEIEEAVYLLSRSRDIKVLKGDQFGLTFTLGCLGDAYRRAGEFDRAIESYTEDLRITESLGIEHAAAPVACKLAETEICAGVFAPEDGLLDSGIGRLRQICGRDGLSEQVRFFIGKGLAKGLMWKAAATDAEALPRLLSDAESVLNRLAPFSPYSAAHLARLKGRLARLRGDTTAVPSLSQAKESFTAMRAGVESRLCSLQAICCSLEAAAAMSVENDRTRRLRTACRELREFMNSLQGLLGPARERLECLLDAASSAGSEGAGQAAALNRLIAFLEG